MQRIGMTLYGNDTYYYCGEEGEGNYYLNHDGGLNYRLRFDVPEEVIIEQLETIRQDFSNTLTVIMHEVIEFFSDVEFMPGSGIIIDNKSDDVDESIAEKDEDNRAGNHSNTSARVFLCHASQDKGVVNYIASALREEGIDYWLDTEQIHVGEDFIQRIEEGIAECRFIAVFLSSNFVLYGPWAKQEYKIALDKQIKLNHTSLLPILIEDCDIPSMLSTRHYADMREDKEKGLQQLIRSIKYHTTIDNHAR